MRALHQIVELLPALAADLEQVTEASRGKERRPREFALEQCVSRYSGAETDKAHFGGLALGERQDLADALDRRPEGVCGGGGQLVANSFTGRDIDQV